MPGSGYRHITANGPSSGMIHPPMRLDPKGYYAELDLPPAAPAAAITAAYRRKARRVHPDVSGTGSLDAFLRLQAAYDVVGNPVRRAAYDREARSPKRTPPAAEPAAGAPFRPQPPPRWDVPEEPSGPAFAPRLAGLPLPIALLLGGLVCFTAVTGVLQVMRPPPARHETGPPRAPPALPPDPNAPRAVPQPDSPAALQVPGTPSHFIEPGAGPARLWRGDPSQRLAPAEMLPPFTAVHVLQRLPRDGLVRIELADGGTGYIDAVRLVPGSEAAAHRAFCTYNAGPSPANGEVLDRHGTGTGTIRIENRAAQPAVVKLRNQQDETAASVFLDPGGIATVDGLPDGPYRPEFAIGEVWSRACNAFAAGMRSQRSGASIALGERPLVIPADASEDIPDDAFNRGQ
jgi:hypothetical protein